MVLRRNECGCLHVQGAAVLGTDLFSGARRLLLTCSTERTLSSRSVSPAAVQFLLFHRFVSKRHNPFVNYFLHVLFQEVTPSRH